MSFYPQPNKYQCGPFALKYALVALGIFKNEKSIARIAGSTWWAGTTEIGLARAARNFDCELRHFHNSNPLKALLMLNRYLDKGIPCILSVDNWEHWFSVINYKRKHYVIIDSGLEKVIQITPASKLLKRWKYRSEEENYTSYDGYALTPKFRPQTKAEFTIEKAREAMYDKNSDLAKKWDSYFNDMISICRPVNPNAQNFITFPEFLRRYEKMLVRQTANWHGDPTLSELKKILHNMEFVAEVYNLVVYEEDIKRALIDVAILLTMYSCGKYGMIEIY